MIKSPEALAHFAVPAQSGSVAPAATKLLHAALFLALLISPLVFIEPSPYEVATGLLAFVCVIAGVRFDAKILPLALLLVILNVGGAWPLLFQADENEALKYASVSFYLSMTAVVYACLFAQDTFRRLEIMRRAYLIAAFLAAVVGIAGYFGFIPEAALYGRARSTFKDPNVFGPFLILPLLFLIQSVIARGIRLRYILLFGVLAFALLLSFSRGAWAHFMLSAGILLVLTFLTAPDIRTRFRLVLLSIMSVIALGGFLAVALSFDSVGELFKERAKLTQSYDVGGGGRFDLQDKAVDAVLENPGGMGPHGFERAHGGLQHNVYLQAFLVYSWMGGFAYVLLVVLTLLVGFRLSFIRTPWQPYLTAALATFCGLAVEGFIIDTDHWRHFFLMLGIIWGLAAATINAASPTARRNAHPGQ